MFGQCKSGAASTKRCSKKSPSPTLCLPLSSLLHLFHLGWVQRKKTFGNNYSRFLSGMDDPSFHPTKRIKAPTPTNNYKKDVDAAASTRMPLRRVRPAVTLTFDLQNPIRSSAGANKLSLSVLSILLKPFMRYRGNNICLDERRERTDSKKTSLYSQHCQAVKTYKSPQIIIIIIIIMRHL